MKIKRIIFSGFLAFTSTFSGETNLFGDIQIQSSKAIFRGTTLLGDLRAKNTDNVDQLFGRTNLNWSFSEDSVFSSLVHIQAYPSGFGFEPLIGAGWDKDTTNRDVPAITAANATNSGMPTLQVYEAWIRYKFTDFDVRIGRMITNNSASKHFGNYLDVAPGGTFTYARDGIHNALEFYKTVGMFNTQVHLGVGDVKGNRGYLRLYETIKPLEGLSLGMGYKVNVFDLIHFDADIDESYLTNILDAGIVYDVNSVLKLYIESSWGHQKGQNARTDQTPTLFGSELNMVPVLDKLEVPPVMDKMRIEFEWQEDRRFIQGPYHGIDKDFLWNVYVAKKWLKRINLEGGVFAAPSTTKAYDIGVGGRFTSSIN